MNSLEELGAPLGPGRCQVCTARRRRLRRRFAVPSAAALRAGVHTGFHRIPLDFTGFHKVACAGGWRGLTTDSHRRISQGLTGFPRVARYSTGFHRIPRDWLAARLAGWLAQRLGVLFPVKRQLGRIPAKRKPCCIGGVVRMGESELVPAPVGKQLRCPPLSAATAHWAGAQ